MLDRICNKKKIRGTKREKEKPSQLIAEQGQALHNTHYIIVILFYFHSLTSFFFSQIVVFIAEHMRIGVNFISFHALPRD